jgi:hypothetical protein
VKPKKRNIQQHFVTASYLGGFTPDGSRSSQLYVYERNTQRMFRLAPDEAAKRRNYYSIPKLDGGFIDDVDVMLTALEGQALPSLRKIVSKNYDLSTFERALLAYLIAFQEFRTPWSRAIFQKMQLSLTQQAMRVGAKTPGHFERILKKLETEGKLDGTVSADQLRDALKNKTIKLQVQPHAGIDTMVSTSQSIGNIYTQMRWTVFHAKDGEFLTSDTPVTRRNPSFKGGMYGGGLMAADAQVWFPLAKDACLLISHDNDRMKEFDELIEAGKAMEAEALTAELPSIRGIEIPRDDVDAVNAHTIVKADRFVYSPFESGQISDLLQGKTQNLDIAISPPFQESTVDNEK